MVSFSRWKGMMIMLQSYVILVKCIPLCCDMRITVRQNTILIISSIHAHVLVPKDHYQAPTYTIQNFYRHIYLCFKSYIVMAAGLKDRIE
jgi:hypothetical protein